MLFNVVIITHFGGEALQNCVDSLRRQSQHFDRLLVIVSSEHQVELPDEETLHLGENAGYSAAINAAFEELAGPILILNDDTIIPDETLKILAQNYRTDCILQPVIRYIDNPSFIENTGHRLHLDGANKAHSRGRKEPQGKNVQRMCFSGAAFLLPPDIIKAVGQFDTKLSPFGEDLDYSLRSIRAGFSIVVVPDAIVYHQLGGSFGRYSREKVQWVESHRIQAKFRSLPWFCIALSPLSSLLRYWRSSKEELLVPPENRGEAILATIKGIVDGYRNLPQSTKKRYQDVHQRNDLDFLLHWLKVRKMQL